MSRDEEDRPEDWVSTAYTRDYLIACSNLFERGFLSHSQIGNNQHDVLNNIRAGMQYFIDWYSNLSKGDNFHPTSTTERKFLSWQTFDLLRIAVYGFLDFVERFILEYPEYYVLPLKLNGSAVETLFAQFKYESAGKLTSVNYSTARKSVLLKRDIHQSTKDARGYRSTPLYVRDKQLKRSVKKGTP